MKTEKKELDRFQVLKSYADSIRQLELGDKQLAYELSYWIIQYGIYGEEPGEDSNYVLLSIRKQIRLPIEKCRNKSENAMKTFEKPRKKKEENKVENKELVEVKKEEYGNPEINKCLELIKKYNNGIVDGTQKKQRQFGQHLINKLKKIEGVESGKFTRDGTLEIILQTISKNKFYCGKINGPESIYNNLTQLMQIVKTDYQKNQTSNLVLNSV